MSDVVTLGETMALVKADQPGPLAQAHALSLAIGGAESNFAVAAARLGASVTWVGRVGRDSLGDLVLRELRAEGLDVVGVRDDEAPTGLMLKERRTADQLRVWYYRRGSAGSRLRPEDVPEAAVTGARLLHVTGITPALSEDAAAAVAHAVRLARTAGVLVSFDLNYRSKLWSPAEAAPVFRTLAAQADVVFAGEDEAAIAVGPGTADALARRLAELGPAQVVLKQGAAGAYALVDGVEHEQAALAVTPVDTVGAGDGFVAGYVAELLAGLGVTERLATAVRVGAFACLVPGDWEGMPTRAELGMLDQVEPVSR